MITATSTDAANNDNASIPRDHVAWDIYGNWKEMPSACDGCGTPAPSIPRSQRQYDGDNPFDNCEVWAI